MPIGVQVALGVLGMAAFLVVQGLILYRCLIAESALRQRNTEHGDVVSKLSGIEVEWTGFREQINRMVSRMAQYKRRDDERESGEEPTGNPQSASDALLSGADPAAPVAAVTNDETRRALRRQLGALRG